MNKIIIIIFSLFLISFNVNGQSTPFSIHLESVEIEELGGLQSYAFGQHNGKWLVVGGRLDGLHRRQPWASFDLAGHNDQLIVIDPVSQQKWNSPLSDLPVAIQEQLSSTNMEFYQEGGYLYCLGGYGYSNTFGDHTTFDKLTAIKVPEVIDAIINSEIIEPYFRQITDTEFQVTGGKLLKINNTFHLVGGHKFIGRYNPMGPDHGPGFIQEYTDAIRKFTITDDGINIIINHLSGFQDAANLHRRDFNVVSQILPDGTEGLTAFSGVFQPVIDLPFLNCVDIDANNYTVNNSFQQYYNHYHCATLPLYDEDHNEMHNIFFGGIAQYYDSLGILVQDNNVPFTNAIARVTRDADGSMAEYLLPVEMPGLLGAGSEFIPNENIPHYSNDVFKLNDFSSDSTLAGYIYGGISSSAKNIFWINNGTESIASSQIYKVYVVKDETLDAHFLNQQSKGSLNLTVYPNPNEGDIIINFNLDKITETKISIVAASGRIIDEEKVIPNLRLGENRYSRSIFNLERGGIYFVFLETEYEKAVQKIIVEP